MIREKYHEILRKIEKAGTESGFNKNVTLVAVSKTHPVADILEIYEEGQRDFGENRPQELAEKYEQLPHDIRWHMIGHLQTNKVRMIIDKVCMIHSVDSVKLAQVIDKEAEKLGCCMDILVEVNIGCEPQKSGIYPDHLEEMLRTIADLKNIKVRGLMCIPPANISSKESSYYFKLLRNLSIDIKGLNIDNIQMNILSMGMSDDFETAILCGADIVRVGTGIFGMRDYSK